MSPTTTSFAVLGLLSVRPWSSYELSGQVGRALAYCWPTTERAVYAQLKRLEEDGLARATVTWTGDRRRTEYAITPRGRAALRRWLGADAAPPRMECEAVLKATFADQGGRDDLLATLRQLRLEGEELASRAEQILAGYAAGEGPFPDRAHLVALLGAFNLGYARHLAAWAEWAEREVAAWEGTRTGADAGRHAEILAALAGGVVTAELFRAPATRARP